MTTGEDPQRSAHWPPPTHCAVVPAVSATQAFAGCPITSQDVSLVASGCGCTPISDHRPARGDAEGRWPASRNNPPERR